jgi:hypothetical protein
MKLDKSKAWLLAKSVLLAVCTAEGISDKGCEMLGMGMVPTMVTTGNAVTSCAHVLVPAHMAITAKETKEGRSFVIRTLPKSNTKRGRCNTFKS